MAKEAVVQVADLHINSTLALAKPGILRDDGDVYLPNLTQKWLWTQWEMCLTDIENLTKGYHVNLVLVGDIIELDAKTRSWQIISRNPATALSHTIDVLEPLVKMADTTFVLRGTEAHTGQSAWAEEEIARDIDAEAEPNSRTKSWWHLRADFSKVTFDIAHHHSMGNLPWTYANAANKLAFTVMQDYIDWGEKPPDVATRAHNHRFADSGRTYPTRGIFLPAWQFHTAYLHRVGKANARPHVGACVFLCDNGEYKFHDLIYTPRRSKPWTRK